VEPQVSVVSLPKRLFLVDDKAKLVGLWREAFAPFPEVVPECADFFAREADALVSPANSFGVMDGGLDLAIRNRLGRAVETAVRERIRAEHHGELPVGSAEIVATEHPVWPYLVCAPTMRVPENISGTLNAYLAFRAALLAVRRHNQRSPEQAIASLVCPGLGTGVGRLDPGRCAVQMRTAYESLLATPDLPPFERIHGAHLRMLSA
jgi:O-acetyl-ADP-ribose deacetylase (regulator of RNase III)